SLHSMFHMTNDSGLFQMDSQLTSSGNVLVGNVFKNETKKWLPLYESKMFHQYNHRFGTYKGFKKKPDKRLNKLNLTDPKELAIPWYWVDEAEIKNRISDFNNNYMMSYRVITNSSTNARTGMFTLLPMCALGNSASIIQTSVSPLKSLILLSLLNSYVVDFIIRQKIGGANLSNYIVEQLAILPPDKFDVEISKFIIPKIFELLFTAIDILDTPKTIWREIDSDTRKMINSQWLDNIANTSVHKLEEFSPKIKYLASIDDYLQDTQNFPPFFWNDDRRFQIQCELDALFGHLYNLTRDEFAFILDSFPIIRNYDLADYGDYRTKQIILEKFDALADDPMLKGACIPLAERVSVINKPAKSQAEKTAPTPPPAPKSDPKPQPAPLKPKLTEVSQPDLPAAPAVKEPQSALLSDYTLHYCPKCEKRVLGFDRENHTRERHSGVDPGYDKID
ncbi:MAG: hypothetical protein K0B14_13470, partial [Anaerolineaceae bacterium]|nr:hypothetical protein [Anaerolineaceae bacterium]